MDLIEAEFVCCIFVLLMYFPLLVQGFWVNSNACFCRGDESCKLFMVDNIDFLDLLMCRSSFVNDDVVLAFCVFSLQLMLCCYPRH